MDFKGWYFYFPWGCVMHTPNRQTNDFIKINNQALGGSVEKTSDTSGINLSEKFSNST